MPSRSYHNPPSPASNRRQCPVCRKPVYSSGGIHPQCAAKQAESQPPEADPASPVTAD